MRLTFFPCWRRELVEEEVGELEDVGLAIAERRNEDREHVQAIEQVFAEPLADDRRFEILVGRRDQADVGLNRLRSAEPLELARLQHAQQLDLRRQIQLADFVEEQRAAFGQLEAALLRRVRTGERALLVTEQLRLDQIVRQRGAAHLDERLLRARRVVVNGVGDELLAGARFAAQEHRRVGLRHLRDLRVHVVHLAAGANDVGEAVALVELEPQVRVLFDQALAIGFDEPMHLHRLRDHRADDGQKRHRAFVVAVRRVLEIDLELSDRLPLVRDRHRDVGDLLAAGRPCAHTASEIAAPAARPAR